jgi:hypothetical protein
MMGIYKFNTKEVKILYLVLIILINSAGWFRNALAWTQPITPVISQHPVDICLNPKDYEILSWDNNFLYEWMLQRKVVALAEIFPIQSSIM